MGKKQNMQNVNTSQKVSQAIINSLKNMANKALDKQIGGSHYLKHKIQFWEIVEEYNLDFWEANVLKYLIRDKNNRKEDLQKLIHYAEYCIERLEK